jgi:hypothetical protein
VKRFIPPLVAAACGILFALAAATALLEAPTVCESGNALQGMKIAHGIEIYRDPAHGPSAFPYTPLYPLVLASIESATNADPVRLGRAVSLAAIVLALALVRGQAQREGRSRAVTLTLILWVLAALWSIDMIALEAYPNALAAAIALASVLAWQRGLDSGAFRLAALGAALAVLAAFTKQTLLWVGLYYLVATLRARGFSWFARLGLVVVGASSASLLTIPLVGSHIFFYTVTSPGAQGRSFALLKDNIIYGGPLLGSALVLSLFVAWWSRWRNAVRDPRFHVAILAIATAVFFSSKIGSRGYALISVPFLVLPWLLREGEALDSFREHWVADVPVLPIFCLLALIPAVHRAESSLDSQRAHARWAKDMQGVVASVTSARSVYYSDAYANWTFAHELTPEVFEVALEAYDARPTAVEDFFAAFLAHRYDVVVLCCAPEYEPNYSGVFDRKLVEAHYDCIAIDRRSKPRTIFDKGFPPESRVYTRKP